MSPAIYLIRYSIQYLGIVYVTGNLCNQAFYTIPSHAKKVQAMYEMNSIS